MVNALIMVVLGVVAWFYLPRETLLKSGTDSKSARREVAAGIGTTLRFSGSVIAIAAFLIYLPSSFAYLLWGWMLDNNEGAAGYRYMFVTLAIVAIVGVALAHGLKRRIASGASDKMAFKVQQLDQRLGLQGKEKTLSGLIDAEGS